MKTNYVFILLTAFLLSCGPQKTTSKATSTDDGLFQLTIVQVNDVYEIAPVSNGKEGGLARIASLKKQELAKNPNTFLMMAGDFLSPSVFNSLKYNGQRIRGAQMIDAMNAAGFDFVGFGNHEFDIKYKEFQQRLNESEFTWVSSNTFEWKKPMVVPFHREKNGQKEEIPTEIILQLEDADGTQVKVGIFSVLLPFNQADYVAYTDVFATAHKQYNKLAKECDAVIALTHLSMKDDEKLARELPGLAMIIGGHEHDGRYAQIGNVAITKALANARDAYVNTLLIDKNNNTLSAEEKRVPLNETIPLDASTQKVVNKWMDIAADSYAEVGFDANRVVISSGEPFDILETSVRHHPTNFTRLVVKSMENACPNADVAIVNSGSMRLDDMLSPPISEYDILRCLPYGGKIVEADIKGKLLKKVLDVGMKNITIGGFLQFSEKITQEEKNWLIAGKPIQDEAVYLVAFSDFLFAGLEANLEFLHADNPDVVEVHVLPMNTMHPQHDIRRAVIQYMDKNL